MPLQVIDRHERDRAPVRKALGVTDPNEECSDQARTGTDGHPRNVRTRTASFGECRADGGIDQFEVSPRCDLGHHAAERHVFRGLTRDDR